jgi:membrane protease subunit HflC
MNRLSTLVIGILVLLGLIVLLSSAFVVNETEQAIITQFGKPVGDPILAPGIHFKAPIIQKVHFLRSAFWNWDGAPNQIPTKDKRFIWVDAMHAGGSTILFSIFNAFETNGGPTHGWMIFWRMKI